MTRAKTFRAILAGAGLLALAACASTPLVQAGSGAPAITPTEQWTDKVRVSNAPDEVLLAVHAEGLSPRQIDALNGLLARFTEAEAKELVVLAPVGGPEATAAGRMAAAARAYLIDAGAPRFSVRIDSYPADGDKAPPLRVGYLRHEVEVPRCGSWGNLTATGNNDAYGNFGCAVTANIASQVANPADLQGPRREDPADAMRRGVVMGKYRAGEPTASQKDAQSDGAVSRVVK
ncbi:CpaD family pilus assembly protein [Caulobacter endophyticus]|uniref:CpaD family pilus assembly protein n=1 Tax=Caulobacter endophyticus TaxID=2172652 RepID=UPI00241024BA|nr:CpaD family pilus assembly protein [Caulobacter endophyticus]MDG2530982.1 CpaD family pilus assembly protein [Caulobacter endophyticus]